MGLTLITGHYGCGKTNLSLNLVRDLRTQGRRVALVDLDIANPFFRSSDSAEALIAEGIDVAGPIFANSNLDAPALDPKIYTLLTDDDPELSVVVDVGGDDEGATTLGRFHEQVAAQGYEMLYVVNPHRLQTATPLQAADLLHEIEGASRLSATGIVGNAHLKDMTDVDTVVASLPYVHEVAARAGLPIAFLTAPRAIAPEVRERLAASSDVPVRAIDVHLHTPWE